MDNSNQVSYYVESFMGGKYVHIYVKVYLGEMCNNTRTIVNCRGHLLRTR